MQACQHRTQAVAQILVSLRERVNANVALRLGDRESIQIALAASMRDAEDVMAFLLPHQLARTANKVHDKIRLRADEWTTLFGNGAQAMRDGGVSSVVQSKEFAPQILKLANALKTTISEKDQHAIWDRSWSKILCYMAMHLDDADDALVGVMGNVIKADGRRIEELQCTIDDDGPEVMLVSRCIVALSECIV